MLKTSQYCITQANVLCHELIGLKAKVTKSSDKNKAGLQGVIIDETKNTLVLQTKDGVKVLPKKEVWLELNLGRAKVEINGNLINLKPENRTKALWRKCHA